MPTAVGLEMKGARASSPQAVVAGFVGCEHCGRVENLAGRNRRVTCATCGGPLHTLDGAEARALARERRVADQFRRVALLARARRDRPLPGRRIASDLEWEFEFRHQASGHYETIGVARGSTWRQAVEDLGRRNLFRPGHCRIRHVEDPGPWTIAPGTASEFRVLRGAGTSRVPIQPAPYPDVPTGTPKRRTPGGRGRENGVAPRTARGKDLETSIFADARCG